MLKDETDAKAMASEAKIKLLFSNDKVIRVSGGHSRLSAIYPPKRTHSPIPSFSLRRAIPGLVIAGFVMPAEDLQVLSATNKYSLKKNLST
jgi:hypothetical protein